MQPAGEPTIHPSCHLISSSPRLLFLTQLLIIPPRDPSFDYTGKKVAVIGNGSAGIQIFTEVAKKAAKTVNFNRHNTWITSNIAAQYTPEGRNFAYSKEQIEEWKQHPDKFFAYRKELEAGLNYLWPMMIKDGAENRDITELSRKIMTQRLGESQALAERFIPKHAFGCRRLTPGDGYLETCTQSKTARAELSPIIRITETGIETADGGHEEFDLIGCATGYVVDFVPSWKVVGLDGFDLNEAWERDGATGYFAVCVPKVPNFFMYHGPNAPVGQGSILRAQGWYTDYILQWVERIAKEDIKYVAPSLSPVTEKSMVSMLTEADASLPRKKSQTTTTSISRRTSSARCGQATARDGTRALSRHRRTEGSWHCTAAASCTSRRVWSASAARTLSSSTGTRRTGSRSWGMVRRRGRGARGAICRIIWILTGKMRCTWGAINA